MAAYYTFEDLSGSISSGVKTDNPYHDLIESCENDPAQIQARYDAHRTNRNAQQKQKLLAPDFAGVVVDEILAKLENPDRFPGFADPRHCLVFWARPPARVKALIARVQSRIKDIVPDIWLMPPSSLHMTALEITHSLTAPEIASLVSQLQPHAEEICNHTLHHRARLVKPLLSFDAQALALSWLPAATTSSGSSRGDEVGYTYHHLRRDLFALASRTGVKVESRYVIPSAHLTIARFVTEGDDGGKGKVREIVDMCEEVNAWLMKEYWPQDGEGGEEGMEWIVGEEKGLDFRMGRLWYGGGETLKLGEGF